MYVLFIFSYLIMCIINPEKFAVANLSLCRPAANFEIVLYSGLIGIIQSCFRSCLITWFVLDNWLQVLGWIL